MQGKNFHYFFCTQVKSKDRSLVAVEPTGREDEETRVKYEISVVGTHNDSFKDVAIEFKSSITEQKVLVFVTFSGKLDLNRICILHLLSVTLIGSTGLPRVLEVLFFLH